MAGKRRFRGPGGGLFVPHPTVDEVTIKTMVDSGEWTPVEDEQPPGPGVPTGTIDEVLAWVGEDAGRAQKALDAENGRGEQARSTLVAKLTAVAQPQQ